MQTSIFRNHYQVHEIVSSYRISTPAKELPQVQFKSSSDIEEYCRLVWIEYPDLMIRERMLAIYMNRANRVIAWNLISVGGVSGTVVDVKLVMKGAIDVLASAIVLVHNHPSGNLRPSDADAKLTSKIKEACNVLDMTLLDHLILTEHSYYSFADNGLM